MHCRSCLYSSVCLSDCIVRRKREIEALTPFSTLPAWLWHSTYAAVHPPTMESQHILFIYRLGCSFHIFIAPVQAESYRVESKLSFCASCVCVRLPRIDWTTYTHIHYTFPNNSASQPRLHVLTRGRQQHDTVGRSNTQCMGRAEKNFHKPFDFFPSFPFISLWSIPFDIIFLLYTITVFDSGTYTKRPQCLLSSNESTNPSSTASKHTSRIDKRCAHWTNDRATLCFFFFFLFSGRGPCSPTLSAVMPCSMNTFSCLVVSSLCVRCVCLRCACWLSLLHLRSMIIQWLITGSCLADNTRHTNTHTPNFHKNKIWIWMK